MADNVCDQGAEHRLFRDILLYSLMTTYEAQLSSTCLPMLSVMCVQWDRSGTQRGLHCSLLEMLGLPGG